MNTAMGAFNASELTPSESLVTSDDEEIKVGDHRAWYCNCVISRPLDGL